jgi:hypothetical protein
MAPLIGDAEMTQVNAGTDHLTLTSAGNAATGAHLVWRTSAGTEQGLVTALGKVVLKDTYALEFGSLSSGAGDVSMAFDGTQINVIPSTANTVWFFGDTTAGLDVRLVSSFQGGGGYALWDASAARLQLRKSTNANFTRLNLPLLTTSPTTGMQKGDIFLKTGSSATLITLGLCISTATNLVQYTRRFELGPTSAS